MAAAGLLVAGVVAPVESLPGPLEGLAPAPPAEAAAGIVVAGTLKDCSTLAPDTTWTVVSDSGDRDCVLTSPAVCPDGHVKPTTSGTPSYLCYPQSCSDTAFDVDRVGEYWMPLAGVDTSGVDACRVFQLTRCQTGIGPTHEGLCRYVQRHPWDCPDGYEQHNRFNACYQAHTPLQSGTPPACDTSTGAPDFPLLNCEDYVGDDYDDDEGCADISSHLTDRSGGAAAAYWCEFEAYELSVDCHRNLRPGDADCTPSTGVCLKRASTTRGQQIRAFGGCRAIARNIECAIHQAGYADQVGTGTDLGALADTIRGDGCEPCRVMPFQPPNSDCAALSGVPETVDLNVNQQRIDAGIVSDQKSAFQNRESSGQGCRELPPGRLTWSAPSFTGLAMVNTRIRLDLEWDEANISRAPAASTSAGLVQCFLRSTLAQTDGETKVRVYFAVEVEPLWPQGDPDDSSDTGDRTLIEELFGSGSLRWWDALSAAEQSERTTAFYATTGTAAVEVACSLSVPVWCVWEPRQSGYYSLTAIGALRASQLNIHKNPGYSGALPTEWHDQLSYETLKACDRNPPPTCQFLPTGSSSVGVYINNEPIGIQVHEVRVVSRTPSP